MCLILYYEHGIHAGPNTGSIHFDSCSHPCVHRLFVALDFLLCVMACCLSRSCLRFSGVGRKMAIFWGPFSGHQFWQEGVRPNCLASPLLAKICGQKMATLLGTPLGRPRSDPRNWGRMVVAVCGPLFGLLCASGFWTLVCVRIVVHKWCLRLSSTNQSTF